MITISNISEVFDEITQIENKEFELLSAALVGSSLFPQFTHPNSDIDIVLLVRNIYPKNMAISKRGSFYSSVTKLKIEYSLFSLQSYLEAITTGNLIIPFTLLSGYKLLYGEESLFLNYKNLSSERFNLTFESFLSDQNILSISDEIKTLFEFLNDLIKTFSISRLNRNRVLFIAKYSYIIRCIILNYFKFYVLCKNILGKNIPQMDKVLFLMINDENCFRILDFEKYKLPPQVQNLIERINEYLNERKEINHTDLEFVLLKISKPFFDDLSNI